jgi:hypothetical protein
MMTYKVGLKLETWKQDDDENLSIIDKTKHSTKGNKKYKVERPKSWQMRNPLKRKKDGNKRFKKKIFHNKCIWINNNSTIFSQYWVPNSLG